MKKASLFLSLILLTSLTQAQDWKDKAQEVFDNTFNGKSLSTSEIISGLKEALNTGSLEATKLASKDKGFYNNSLIKIPFPQDALKIKQTAERLGLSKQVTEFEIQLNKAAEQASQKALPILKEAILGLNFADASAILKGKDNAATNYLEGKTSAKLNAEFSPIVKSVISKMQLTKYYKPLATSYNRTVGLFGKKENVNPDLSAYVTEKALDGLFKLIAEKEKDIRKDPAGQASDILKKVFSKQ